LAWVETLRTHNLYPPYYSARGRQVAALTCRTGTKMRTPTGFVVIVVKTHFLGLPLSLYLCLTFFCHFLFLLFAVVDFVFSRTLPGRGQKREMPACVASAVKNTRNPLWARVSHGLSFLSFSCVGLDRVDERHRTPVLGAGRCIRAEHDHGR
jgi:hypothetical protein